MKLSDVAGYSSEEYAGYYSFLKNSKHFRMMNVLEN